MKDEKENVFSRNLNNLDDADVEKISATVPALDKQAKKRILEKCMSRMSETDFESENTVSGTEKYSRPRIMHYIPTIAACLLAVIGIGGIIMVNRNIVPPVDMPSTPQYTAIPVQSGTTVSSAESTVVNTVTTAVVNTEKTISEVITVPLTKVQQVTESITDIVTEMPTKVQQVTESITEVITEIPTKVQQVTESVTEIVTETTTEPITENKSFVGTYGDKNEIDYGAGNQIIITETSDNSYDVYVGFFRVIGFTDCIGSVDDNVLKFYAPSEIYGEIVFAGEISLNDDGCILKITESENNPIGIDSFYGTQYYRIS